MQLEADFNPRGKVRTEVRVSHGKRQPWLNLRKERL